MEGREGGKQGRKGATVQVRGRLQEQAQRRGRQNKIRLIARQKQDVLSRSREPDGMMAKEGVVVVAGLNPEKSRVLFLAGQNLRPKAEASDRGFGSRSSLTELDSTTPPSTLSLLSLHTMANPRYVRILLWSCVRLR